MAQLTFRAVDRDSWSDFEQLFESRGGPSYCWCMAWRAQGAEAKRAKGAERKQAMKERVEKGVPVGLLGYLDGAPVAWCSIAPRSSYRPLGGPAEPEETERRIWSLACFFIRREHRGEGIGAQLLQAAVDHARSRGARIVEAYPVDPDSPSYRFMGFVPAFERAGFQHVGTAGSRRHVMRLHCA